MPRRSGIGSSNNDDFNFKKSQIPKVQKLEQLRPGDRTSFYLRPNKTLYPKDPCDNLHINDVPSLLNKKGRQPGEIIQYDPVQEKNYLSISARYERSLYLIPANVEKRGNTIIYSFCSSGSPTGYWEVAVTGGATTLTFVNPILTIICPRPFQLKDFTEIDTDAEFILWEQLQGRTAIIFPKSGDGSLNPYISITGAPSDLDPPILIKGDAEADATVTDTLLIYTSPTSNYSGTTFSEVGEVQPRCYSPLPYLAPTSYQSVYVYDSRSLSLTWLNPECDRGYVVSYKLLQNTTGEYVALATLSKEENRLVEIQPNIHYRIETTFEYREKQILKRSDLIYFPYSETSFIKNIFGDDSIRGFAFSAVESVSSKIDLKVTTLLYEDSCSSTPSFSYVENTYSQVELSANRQILEDSYNAQLSYTFIENKITKVDLGGVIIG
jgi:hypothetical protein